MKKLLLIAIMFVLIGQTMAQIGQSKATIKAEEGYEYEVVYLDNGDKSIVYTHTKDDGGRYLMTYVFDGDTCYLMSLIDDVYHVKEYIRFLNNEYVPIGERLWRDYESGLIYEIRTKDSLCMIFMYR